MSNIMLKTSMSEVRKMCGQKPTFKHTAKGRHHYQSTTAISSSKPVFSSFLQFRFGIHFSEKLQLETTFQHWSYHRDLNRLPTSAPTYTRPHQPLLPLPCTRGTFGRRSVLTDPKFLMAPAFHPDKIIRSSHATSTPTS